MEVSYHHFPSGKNYTFIKEPSGPVFIRNMILITKNDDPKTIANVHEWGKGTNRWEPPKGQMEWKEFNNLQLEPNTVLSIKQLHKQMKKGITRELIEESYILPHELKEFKMLPIVYKQDWPESGVPNAKFMYQYWTAKISNETLLEAKRRIHLISDNPELKIILPADVTEKDEIKWWNPEVDGWSSIRGGFSQKMTRLYFNYLDKYGVFKDA